MYGIPEEIKGSIVYELTANNVIIEALCYHGSTQPSI